MIGYAEKPADELNIMEIIKKYGVSLNVAKHLVNVYGFNSGSDWSSYEDAKSFFKQELNLGAHEYEQAMRCVADRLCV